MEMQAIFGNNRPNCIILDEIDGAMAGQEGKGAIAALQALIAAPYTPPSIKKVATKQRSAGGHPVIRPIICICNDQFAPVLRPLRKLAKIFVMHTPDSRQLVQRMKYICHQERVQASNSLLSTLCERADNDVRFCLNALQFASAQTSVLTLSMIDSMMGRKDLSKGAYDVWDTVFFETKDQQKDKSTASLDRLVHYKGLENRLRLPLGIRQTMAREVELENMRRADKGTRPVLDDSTATYIPGVEIAQDIDVSAPDASNPFGLKKRKREDQSTANAKRLARNVSVRKPSPSPASQNQQTQKKRVIPAKEAEKVYLKQVQWKQQKEARASQEREVQLQLEIAQCTFANPYRPEEDSPVKGNDMYFRKAMEWERRRQQLVSEKQQRLLVEKLKDCTFHPHTNPAPNEELAKKQPTLDSILSKSNVTTACEPLPKSKNGTRTEHLEPEDARILPYPWEEYVTEDGYLYYVNTLTRESQWEFP
ncbi:hypothetical protein DYB32_002879 [Aphanomyces invadans]|uniref:WW domain-containing protein n=1 Tax=Aphanomyces invadans TaxID=157072 RepID=A0A418B201_9STRA|nr:hypothetical protein DYB32_002879 [Aphanomyces invadans]